LKLGWDATSSLVSELHPDILKSVLLLYRRYELLNFCVQEYGRTLSDLELASDDPRKVQLKKHLNSTIDTFNTTIDSAREQGRNLAGQLLPLAGLKVPKKSEAPPRDYAQDVEKLLSERAARLKRLGEM
jgi:hypothetical protein